VGREGGYIGDIGRDYFESRIGEHWREELLPP
jgi:hypothetical protein